MKACQAAMLPLKFNVSFGKAYPSAGIARFFCDFLFHLARLVVLRFWARFFKACISQ